MTNWVVVSNELCHHGILGQKWGKRNGPPYPLGASDHSASEKKAGWKKSLNKVEKADEKPYNSKTDAWKRIGKVAAVSAVAALAAYGTYQLVKSDKLQSLVNSGKQIAGGASKQIIIGRSPNQLDKKMIRNINRPGWLTYERQINCTHCTTAYILNSLFGKNVTAKGCSGVDEVSGLVIGGRDVNIYSSIFDNIRRRTTPNGESFSKALSALPNGSTGILFVQNLSPLFGGVGHVINYEKDSSGVVSLIDGQLGRIFDQQRGSSFYERRGLRDVVDVMDFSSATLKPNASNVLKHMVDGF